MVSGDRNVAVGEKGPFWTMQRAFSRHFERIDVLCPRPDRPVVVRTIHANVHFHPADVGRAGMVGYVTRRGAELIAEHGHALVVSHDYGWFYNGIGSARLSARTGVPYVSEIHHVPGYPVAADAREVFDRFVARAYVRWARGRACAFRVVNAGEMPPLLRRWGVPDERIRVLGSLYIDLELFAPRDPAPEPEQDVVFVGRLVSNKGLLRLVDALALLAERGPAPRALLLGRGPLRERVEARVAKRGLTGSVRFLDWVDRPEDLAEVYRRSRVAVCASTCEGGPRVTVEAMACGVPAVSTRVGIMGELLEDGRNGYLAGFDAQSLADALGKCLADEERRRAMGAQARRDVERFEYGRAIARYADGLKELAAECAGRTSARARPARVEDAP